MAELLTLITNIEAGDFPGGAPQPTGFEVRPCDRSDRQQLASLYLEAYDPGIACDTLEEAVADIRASFDGDYGDFWFEASPVVEDHSKIVAAVMAVRRAPWDDTPHCPFIIELFTSRDYRRMGLGRLLVRHCLETVKEAGETTVALRVADDNTPARTLYESLGFTIWPGPPA